MAGAGIARNKPNVPDPLTVQTLTVGQNFILSGISAAISLGVNQDNWNPAELAANTMLLVNPTAAISITGIDATGLANGALVGLRNVHPTNAVTIPNQDGQSLGVNQFTTAGLVDMVINPGDAAIFQYNTTSQKFEVFAFGTQGGGGGGGGEVNTGANVGGGTGLVFRDKTGTTLNFKTILAGANVTVTNGADTVQIDASAPASGTANLTWRFSTSTTAADPGSGNFRFNNADRTLVTELYFSDTTRPGLDATKLLEVLGTDDEIYIQQASDSDAAVLYTLSGAVTDNGDWFTIPVTFVSEDTNAIGNNEDCAIIFLYNGGGGPGGENNTGSNVGTGEGQSFKQKAGVDLQFRSILAGLGARTRTLTDEVAVDVLGSQEFPETQFSYLWDCGTMSRIPEETLNPSFTSQNVANIGPKGVGWTQKGQLDASPEVMVVTPVGAAPDGPGLDNAQRFRTTMGAECAWQHPNIDFNALTAFTVVVGWVRAKLFSQDQGTFRQWLMRQGNSGANSNMISVEVVNTFNSPGNQASVIEAKVDLNTGQELLTYNVPDIFAWYHIELRVSLTQIELLVNNVVVDSVTPAAASYNITTTATDYLEWFGSDLGTGGFQLDGEYGRFHGIAEHYFTDAESVAVFTYRDGPNVDKNGCVLNFWYNQPTLTDSFGVNQRRFQCTLNSGGADTSHPTTAFMNDGFAGKYQCEFYVENGVNQIDSILVGGMNDIHSELSDPGGTNDSSGLWFQNGNVYVNNAVVASLASGAVLKGETIVFKSDMASNGNVTETWERYDANNVFVESVSHTRNAFVGANAERYCPCIGRTVNTISGFVDCRFAPRDMVIPFEEGFSAWTTNGEGQGITPVARAFAPRLAITVALTAAQAIAAGPAQNILFNDEIGGTFPRGSLDTTTGEITIPGSVRGGLFRMSGLANLELDDQELGIAAILVVRSIVFGGNFGVAQFTAQASTPAPVGISMAPIGQPIYLNGGDKVIMQAQHFAGGPRNMGILVGQTQLMLEQID